MLTLPGVGVVPAILSTNVAVGDTVLMSYGLKKRIASIEEVNDKLRFIFEDGTDLVKEKNTMVPVEQEGYVPEQHTPIAAMMNLMMAMVQMQNGQAPQMSATQPVQHQPVPVQATPIEVPKPVAPLQDTKYKSVKKRRSLFDF